MSEGRVLGLARKVLRTALLFLCGAACARADEAPLDLTFGLRQWGLDCSIGYRIAEPHRGWPTRLWLSVGGGYESGYLYRAFDGMDAAGVHVDPPIGDYTALHKMLDLDVASGLSQDLAAGLHVFGLFAIGTFRYERRDPAWSPDALIFGSALPDRTGMTETGLRVGARLRRAIPPELAGRAYPLLYTLEGTLHLAPRWLMNPVADYIRLSAIGTGLVQLVNGRAFELYLAARAGFDAMWGTSFPIHARTTVGGLNVPLFTQRTGLGDAVRGIAVGRYDGTTKAYANLGLRLRFLVTGVFVPVLTFFADAGVSDYRRLDHTLALADVLYTTGANVSAIVANGAEVGYRVSYALNEPDLELRWGYDVTFAAHF